MSSKKQRKKLREEQIQRLIPRAVYRHYKEEQERLYQEELAAVGDNPQITLAEICAMGKMANLRWFGYAVARYNEWVYGNRKLSFKVRTRGKVRAKDIQVKEK